jgi:hypothetical protein
VSAGGGGAAEAAGPSTADTEGVQRRAARSAAASRPEPSHVRPFAVLRATRCRSPGSDKPALCDAARRPQSGVHCTLMSSRRGIGEACCERRALLPAKR